MMCARCRLRYDPDPKNQIFTNPVHCEFCGASLLEDERISGTQLKMTFSMGLSSVNPKFPHLVIPKGSGLIIKAKFDSAKGGDNEKPKHHVYNPDEFGVDKSDDVGPNIYDKFI
jgi:hypothetical protein